MAVTFPPSPNVGDTVTDSTTGAVWVWDGTKWTFTAGSPPPSGGLEGPIIGVTDGSDAAPGMVGEFLESIVVQSDNITIPMGTLAGTFWTITNLNIPAGDWECFGTYLVVCPSSSVPTVAIYLTQDEAAPNEGDILTYDTGVSSAGAYNGKVAGPLRLSISAPITLYLVVGLVWNVNNITHCWGRMSARRMR